MSPLLQIAVMGVSLAGALAGTVDVCLRREARNPAPARRTPGTTRGTAFLPLQKIVDPPARHVIQLEDQAEKRISADDPTTDDGRTPPCWDFTRERSFARRRSPPDYRSTTSVPRRHQLTRSS